MKLSELTTADLAQPEQGKLKLSQLKPSDILEAPEPEQYFAPEEPGQLEALARGIAQEATLGTSDEIIAGIKALGKTAFEPSVKNKSGFEHLLDNYKSYARQQEAVEKMADDEHDWTYGIGKAAGMFMPGGAPMRAFKAASKLGKVGKIATGAGLGAVTGFANTKTDDTLGQKALNTAIGTGLGGVSVPIGDAIGNALGKGINKAGNKILDVAEDSPYVNQLAATVKNASEGGTLFNKTGRANVTYETREAANDLSKRIIDNVDDSLDNMASTFKQANQQGIKASIDDVAQSRILAEIEEPLVSLGYGKEIAKLKSGKMSPQDLNNLRASLFQQVEKLKLDPDPRRMKSNQDIIEKILGRLSETGKYENGAIPLLEDISRKAGVDIAELNADIASRRAVVDPFVQTASEVVANPRHQFKLSSEFAKGEQEKKLANLMHLYLEKAGKTTTLGDEGRMGLSDIEGILRTFKESRPGVGNFDPAMDAKKLQNLAYLNTAKENVAGIREATNPLSKVLNWGVNRVTNVPYRIAEGLGSGKILGVIPTGTKNFSSEAADAILRKSPEELMQMAKVLKSNPKTAKLADEYFKAANSKNPKLITNATFQLMQSPEAKEILGFTNSDDEQNSNNLGNY